MDQAAFGDSRRWHERGCHRSDLSCKDDTDMVAPRNIEREPQCFLSRQGIKKLDPGMGPGK